MFLACLVGAVLAAAPCLRGAWDPWAHSAFVLLVLAGFSGWIAAQVFCGNLPLPYPNRGLGWIVLLMLLLTVSFWTSPIHGLVQTDWWTWMLGFWILMAVPLIPEERRPWVERCILASAWTLGLLAFYQRVFEHDAAPEASLLNPNVFAGYILMVLPLAYRRGQRALAALLILDLFWTRSVGAWASLSLILMVLLYRQGGLMFAMSLLISGITAVSLHDKLATRSFYDRLDWWRSAWEMIQVRPLWGWGPGAFAHMLPAFRHETGMASLYAHSYPLELASGCGLLFFLAWSFWVFRRLGQSRGWVAWSMAGVMIFSIQDYALSVPSNFWLFCYLLAARQPEKQAWFAMEGRLKVPLLIALAGMGVEGALHASAPWRAETWAIEARQSPAPSGGAEALLWKAAARAPHHPLPYDELSALRLKAYQDGGGRGELLSAIGLKERSLELHAYRPAAWRELFHLYRLDGREEQAREAEARAAHYLHGGGL